MNVVTEAWEALAGERRDEAGWHLRRILREAPCEIFAGLHQPGATPSLLIEAPVAAMPRVQRLPGSQGFRVEASRPGLSQTGRGRILLSLADRAYSTVFAVLCLDVAQIAATQSDPASALSTFIDRLHVWQSFMARFGPDGLSEEAVIGLMGELLVLSEYLAPLIGLERAVGGWSGPRGEPNDFSLDNGYLEIKSTIRQAPQSMAIANSAQLDPARGRIVLAHLQLHQSTVGRTLPDIIMAIRNRLMDEAPASLPEFTAQLLAAGYVDVHSDNYMLRLELAAIQFFDVTADFPHIARSELRTGIRECTYSIDLAACAPWSVPSTMLSMLAGIVDG
ncbi:PD-(D/E)XK motif protein [Rhizobium multihospitium]|uniref:Putative PD-(D/E)XK family member n=1 Tax=Rhizobium multihospitium TaxID=410764 RepID=A0A1C3VSE1_9HYPH|nr:PD-(D/E)XK motif protein [Rhizobium multihospitium]SCB30701.1 Putative PD-(D/E)XK family member [Rhizobium multihospitium]